MVMHAADGVAVALLMTIGYGLAAMSPLKDVPKGVALCTVTVCGVFLAWRFMGFSYGN